MLAYDRACALPPYRGGDDDGGHDDDQDSCSIKYKDDECKDAGGKSNIKKMICNSQFLVRVPHADIQSGMTDGAPGPLCSPSHKLIPKYMEVMAAFLFKSLNVTGVSTYSELCHVRGARLFKYPIHDKFSDFIKTANVDVIVSKLEQVFQTLTQLWHICQFTHGDMKCEQVLLTKPGGTPLLNDFDKSSFTVLEGDQPTRIRPKKGRNTGITSIANSLIGWGARTGVDRAVSMPYVTYNPQMEVRSARCPIEDGHKFDMACLVASVLLQVRTEVMLNGLWIELMNKNNMAFLEEWINFRTVKNMRANWASPGIKLEGNSAAARCLTEKALPYDGDTETGRRPVAVLKSTVQWQPPFEFTQVAKVEDEPRSG